MTGTSRTSRMSPRRHTPRGWKASLRIAGVLLALAALAPSAPGRAESPPDVWAAWAEILSAHTRAVDSTVGTTVDYRALSSPPVAASWRTLVDGLAGLPAPASRAEKLALWINAYNILAIDTVVHSYPIDSIRDVGSFLRPVWKRRAGVVAGRTVSLDEIEHAILRPLGDARMHAAIVCASTSCPSLRREPFTAAHLDAELDGAMRRWLASPTKGLRIDRDGGRVTVSRIFHWFAGDFDALGGVRAVVTRYAPEADRAWLQQHADDATLDYFDYDWSLNDVRR